MTEQQNLEESIFLEAIQIESADERSAYLDRACGDNGALRREIDALVRAHGKSGDLLDLPDAAAATTEQPSISEEPGTIIGRYKLLQQIGEGGFGVVFMAEQQEPVVRKVALKIIKPGMDTKEVIARFEAEEQALALMDHPNIAKVLDAGATDTGRPYFVMELVKGIPITDYCDQANATPQERLELFVSVCQAVQHAHQKGLIHRDIKPTNVLVTLHDGKPVVKVIDFGVAKAINQRLTERTLFTKFAQMVGTPMYMSPEQAEMSGLDVDTRSDIYSLGVLLYELLTGTTPFEKERFGKAAYDEIRRIIREEEPPKPSTRISTLGETAPAVARLRKTEPKKLTALVRGDLDWIVMKALEKERSRRYETAKDFADDVSRHLNDEPIEARPPSTAYRVRKFARRNKGPVATALAVMLVLIAGIVGISVALIYAVDQAQTSRRLAAALTQRTRDLQDRTRELERSRDELKLRSDELQRTNDLVCEFAKDDALAAAMAGQRDRTLQAISRARRAGASESWEEMVLGILRLYSRGPDDIEAALAHLERSVDLDRESVAASSLLLKARLMNGRLNLDELGRELEKAQPKTAEDYLFLAWLKTLLEPDEGLKYIRKAVELRNLPLARAVKAETLSMYIRATGKWDVLVEAQKDIRAARDYLPDNPFVLTEDLSLHLAAMLLAGGPERERLRREADQIVAELDRLEVYAPAVWAKANYFQEVGLDEEARKEYERGLEVSTSVVLKTSYATFLYRTGDRERLQSLLEEDHARLKVLRAIVEAETPGGRRAAIDSLRKLAEQSGSGPQVFVIRTLHLLGDGEYAEQVTKRWLASEKVSTTVQAQLEYLAGEMEAEELLDRARKSRFTLATAHHAIAMRCLGEGDREGAMRHFRASLDSSVYAASSLSRAFLERMEAGWPPWVPAEERSE